MITLLAGRFTPAAIVAVQQITLRSPWSYAPAIRSFSSVVRPKVVKPENQSLTFKLVWKMPKDRLISDATQHHGVESYEITIDLPVSKSNGDGNIKTHQRGEKQRQKR